MQVESAFSNFANKETPQLISYQFWCAYTGKWIYIENKSKIIINIDMGPSICANAPCKKVFFSKNLGWSVIQGISYKEKSVTD